jgi:superfamily I DNA and/or RNA helicase
VIIFSSVRAHLAGKDAKENRKYTIGFVGDGRRLNVALSRAKELCIIVGDLNRLQLSKVWKNIILGAQKKGQAFKVSCP